MSRRANPTRRQHGTHTRTVTYCGGRGCGVPTRDQAYLCDDCLEAFAQDLRALVPTRDEPGLWHELWSVIAGERGIDYRALGGGSGGTVSVDDDEPVGAVETGINLNEAAARRASLIEDLLTRMVRECVRLRLSDSAPNGWRPRARRGVPAAAEWLSWRIYAMAYNPKLARLASDLGEVIDAARETIMPLPDVQWLGACQITGCTGNLHARRDDAYAFCSICGAGFVAQEMRDWLIGALEDRFYTAAEIADLYDREPAGRERIRKRLNQWAHRNQLLGWPRVCNWTPGLCPWPGPDLGHNLPKAGLVFRFGDAFDLLIAHDAIEDTGTDDTWGEP